MACLAAGSLRVALKGYPKICASMKFAQSSHSLISTEQNLASLVLGVLWTWLVIQDVGLADRRDALAVVLDIIILAASTWLWWGWLRYGLPLFGGDRK